MTIQTLTLNRHTYAVVPLSEYQQLKQAAKRAGVSTTLPDLPPADKNGLRPAEESVNAVLARSIIQRRLDKGITQSELARMAGIRQETLSRIEGGKHCPQQQTLEKLGAVLDG